MAIDGWWPGWWAKVGIMAGVGDGVSVGGGGADGHMHRWTALSIDLINRELTRVEYRPNLTDDVHFTNLLQNKSRGGRNGIQRLTTLEQAHHRQQPVFKFRSARHPPRQALILL